MDTESGWILFPLREPVAAGTHLAFCLWAIFGMLLLWRLTRGNRLKQLSLGVFGWSMIVLYAASGLYHAIRLPPNDIVFYQLLDHSAIYGLIAGTYTPVFVVLLRGRWRWFLLAAMWALAVTGIACKWLLPMPDYSVTTGFYLAMGWLGLGPVLNLVRVVGLRGVGLGLLGGLFYTAGAVCDVIGWPVLIPQVFGPHELTHLCDMGGTLLHFAFIVRYVVPFPGYVAARIPT